MSTPKKQPVHRASYSVNEFCTRHGIARATVYRWMANGTLKFTTLPSGHRRIPASEDMRIAEVQL